MRILRSMVVGVVFLFPATFLGLIIWFLMDKPMDNSDPVVIGLCNILPIGALVFGLIIGWKSHDLE